MKNASPISSMRIRASKSSTSGAKSEVAVYAHLNVLLVAGIILFILWLALRPHRPGFHLSSFSLPALNPNYPISFSVLDRNPNHNIGIFYDDIDASIFFMDREVGPGSRRSAPPHSSFSSLISPSIDCLGLSFDAGFRSLVFPRSASPLSLIGGAEIVARRCVSVKASSSLECRYGVEDAFLLRFCSFCVENGGDRDLIWCRR
ncbi:hypothetical protein IHE45_14G078600 [Dioscorea alata]|uniref:Uncharacterized protein n=1 Tax=Dioscorea alata TaxID=55571 RepID=A0ACB7USS6_DIOAL|nr:hypothetical protein IHE45_14G078600 [Dioscorea alata]